MMVTPASSDAWMVAIACLRSGRPSIERGISPRPIALTVRLPMGRCCISDLLFGLVGSCGDTGPVRRTLRRRGSRLLPDHVERYPVHDGVVLDRAGVCGP